MKLRFEYNKTFLQNLNKQLDIRKRALPTLKNKETALRLEVKKAKNDAGNRTSELESIVMEQEEGNKIWCEYDFSLLKVDRMILGEKKIAGVRIPVLEEVSLVAAEYNLFSSPKWFSDGISVLRRIIQLEAELRVSKQRIGILEYARKKTTQKVNLYEKVQIPEYENTIRKIKRFLEDEENLMKAAQKIVKSRKEKEMEAGL